MAASIAGSYGLYALDVFQRIQKLSNISQGKVSQGVDTRSRLSAR